MLKKLAAVLWLVLLSLAPGRAAELGWLHTDATRIVDADGKPVILGGVNLGGWLVEEMWMLPFETKPPANNSAGFAEIKDHVTLWATLEKRFGAIEMAKVRMAWRTNWLTPADFDRIQTAKMNCVRLPFLYDMLEEPDGWTWLDKALGWAKARGIYVLLDLHGAPGRQSNDHHTGQAGVNRLFSDPDRVKQAEAVWTKVATRYKNHSEVAGYDLLNEPMGAPNNATLYIVQDRLYRAIRAADTKHIVFIEDGYKGRDEMPWADAVGWQNVAYSTHHYDFNAKSEAEQTAAGSDYLGNLTGFLNYRKIPMLAGEFQFEPHGTPNVLRSFLAKAEQNGISWTIWTYKTAFKDGGGGMWGWIRSEKPLDAINPFTDSIADMIKKCEHFRSENLTEDKGMTAAFQSHGK